MTLQAMNAQDFSKWKIVSKDECLDVRMRVHWDGAGDWAKMKTVVTRTSSVRNLTCVLGTEICNQGVSSGGT